jgi:phage/plasmid primase-like uncharacterized protein
MDAMDQFRAAIRASGLTPPDHIVADGAIHRFSTNGKRSDDAGWYVLHEDSVPAGAFGDWRTGMQQTFRADIGRPLTPQEIQIDLERMRQAQAARQALVEQERAQAAESAAARWERAKPANGHAYLQSKGVSGTDIRELAGELLIPISDTSGAMVNLQRILPDGTKRFLKGGKVVGGYMLLGHTVGDRLVICEGYATGATIHECTRLPVAVAFNAGNLLPVAQAMRAAYPSTRITIAADNDQWTDGNPGMTHAARAAAAVGGDTIAPSFKDVSQRPTDFNDLARLEGADAVKAALLDPPMRYSVQSIGDVLAAPRPRWQVRGLIQEQGLGVVFGEPGCGKSFLVLELMASVARGREWFGRRVRQGVCVYVGLEGSLRDRLAAYMQHHDLSPDDLRDLLVIERQPVNLLHGAADAQGVIESVRRALRGRRPGMLVIDTLNRTMPGGNENSSEDMGAVVAHAGLMQRELACMVIFVHHSGKDSSKGARGHSSLKGAADLELEVVNRDGERSVIAVKVKDGEGDQKIDFSLSSIDLGPTSEHDPEAAPDERDTSLVVVPTVDLSAVCKPSAPRRLPTGRHQRIVFDALKECIGHFGEPLPATSSIPSNVRGVLFSTAQGFASQRIPADSAKRKNEIFGRAMTSLTVDHYVQTWGDWVWIS